jgi:phosphoribosylglycinamide formyltransferase 1
VNIGWLSTGRDAAARNLLADVVGRAGLDEIALNIRVVFCDREPGESSESDLFLELADDLGFSTVCLSSARSWQIAEAGGASRDQWRADFHERAAMLLESFDLDVLVLAGYMLIVSPAMCADYAMLNLHPALPGGPTGSWQEVIWALLSQGAQETGAMIHVVTPQLDRGPVVAFDRFAIVGDGFDPLWREFRQKTASGGPAAVAAAEGEAEPLFAAVRRYGEQREIPLLYQTVKAFVTGRLHVKAGCCVFGDGVALPLDLSAEVTAELEARG